MRNAEAAIAAGFYDHEQELAMDREDRADDWGADSVFETHPRRRFGRLGGGEGQARRHAGVRSSRAAQFERRASGPVDTPVSDPWLDEPPSAEALMSGVKWSEPPAPDVPLATVSTEEPVPAGRRTVVVTGRPGGTALPAPRPPAAARRRPRRRATDRFGARPDRVAGWAFALGMLLILVAVGTADAAPL